MEHVQFLFLILDVWVDVESAILEAVEASGFGCRYFGGEIAA